MEAKNMLNSSIEAIVSLQNYKFPKTKHHSGEYAIIVANVEQLVTRQFPDDIDSKEIIIVGHLPELRPGEKYKFYGNLIYNKTYGYQFEATYMQLLYDFTSKKEQIAFLSYFLTENQINALFAAHPDPISLLRDKNIKTLTEIKGIGPVTAKRMCNKYEDCKDNSRAYIVLKDLGLTKNAIDKLVANYKSPDIVVEKIQSNPYILIKEVRGYGWKKADAIALNMGFTTDCKFRVLAYAQYYLNEHANNNGNSWILLDELLNSVYQECTPVTKDSLVTWIKESLITEEEFNHKYNKCKDKAHDNLLSIISNNDQFLFVYDKIAHRIGTIHLRLLEKEIARHLIRLHTSPSQYSFDEKVCEKIIAQVEKEKQFTYTEEQKTAIYKILNNNVSVLTGSAGTGKTTTMIAVSRILKHYHLQVAQCALSGRASSNLSEMTDLEGSTIHRLLRYTPDLESFAITERNPLHVGAVILDEVSMVGGELFLSLVSAIPSGSKFVMIGDPNQLESIGFCNILQDCLTSHYIPSVALTTIHRQAARSGIIVNANLACASVNLVANNFVGTDIRGELQDFKINCVLSSDLVFYNIIDEFKQLYIDQQVPAKDIQIIVPMRSRGNISCRVLNQAIQQIVNAPKSQAAVEVPMKDGDIHYTITFRVNDRIIVNSNNYHALSVNGDEVAIFNGNIGYITDIQSDYLVVSLQEQGKVIIEKEKWGDLQLAYAITCHKLQGSSAPYVIIGLNNTNYVMLSKELVYTAITRAKHYCVVVTQPNIINHAVHQTKITVKKTWLGLDLRNEAMQTAIKKGAIYGL